MRVRRDKSCNLLPEERDRHLFKDGAWPNMEGLEQKWELSADESYLSRTLLVTDPSNGTETEAHEAMVRFPSAPVYGTHRPPSQRYEIAEEWPNYHTMRVVTREDLSASQAKQVFLLHNGLNETKDMGFHYCLANWILSECPDAACIIRPLPGHLSRYPFQSPFTERPLDNFLLDPALVYRQFLRYMLETQWLLSALAPRNDYDLSTGCDLLLYGVEPGRDSAEALATEIAVQANRALKASEGLGTHSRETLLEDDVRGCVETLRQLLGWSAIDPGTPPAPDKVDPPAIHAVGYSMGGFLAQSVFCAWPYVVASCSNLFAGGALRDLAPTAFAHPEEWQSVLHGLRSELDEARVGNFFARSDIEDEGLSPGSGEQVVGIERGTFEYFGHVFDEVFLQVNAGSYSTRLAEFSRRFFFILGGDDPIVRTRNVLDAAPPGGITLHQIGDLSHFPSKRNSEPAEKEQRDFWLPEAGRMIGRFAGRAATLLQQTNSRCWSAESHKPIEEKEGEREPSRDHRLDWALPNLLFEQELDAVVAVLEEPDPGWLFIARNQMPTAFFGDGAYRAYGAAMHHAEDLIGEYVRSIALRAKKLEGAKDRISLLIPSDQVAGREDSDWAHERARFSKSESAMRVLLDPDSGIWDHFEKEWQGEGVVRLVDANEYDAEDLAPIGPIWATKRNRDLPRVSLTMLPDMWMAFSREACLELLGAAPSAGRTKVEQGMVKLACELAGDPDVRQDELNYATKLHKLRMRGEVRTVEVSGAELNPRYRGRVLDDTSEDTERAVTQMIIHWAMASQVSHEYATATE